MTKHCIGVWLVLVSACGGDSTNNTNTQQTPAHCPSLAPLGYQMSGTCCARASNAERLDAPEFRVAGIDITAPEVLSQSFIESLITSFIDQETFNWIVQISNAGADGTITVTTGYGARNIETGTFAFDSADPELVPVTFDATLTGEVFSSDAIEQTVILPVLGDLPAPGQPVEATVKLPVRALELSDVTMSESRTCVGYRGTEGAEAQSYIPAAHISGFISADDAKTVVVEELADNSLCNILSCNLDCGDCEGTPQNEWQRKPDSICNEDGCQQNETTDVNDNNMVDSYCDPDIDCNAWKLELDLAAQGVEITD